MTKSDSPAQVDFCKALTVGQLTEIWNASDDDIRSWCKEGHVQGAEKKSGVWRIPADAMRPVDKKLIKEILLQHIKCQNGILTGIDLSEWGISEADLWLYFSVLISEGYFKPIDGDPVASGLKSKGLLLTAKGIRAVQYCSPSNGAANNQATFPIARRASVLAGEFLGSAVGAYIRTTSDGCVLPFSMQLYENICVTEEAVGQ